MGVTYLTLTVSNVSDPGKSRDLEFLIDSGAVYSLVPGGILAELGIRPQRSHVFSMVDGTPLRRDVGHALFSYAGIAAPAPVIFGEPGDEPLLGATTLEAMSLVLDPFKRELRPMALRI